MSDRKKDHIQLASDAQVDRGQRDTRFNYEPLLASHTQEVDLSLTFLNKRLNYPIWISSMTGGTANGARLNCNLARLASEFGLGMGLGSLRPLLESDRYFDDFNVRQYIGNELPLYGNLGVAQIEELVKHDKIDVLCNLVSKLQLDGIFVHINPMQEFLQPEGDRYTVAPIETIGRLLEDVDFPVLVKEVGSGMGPESIKALFGLPIAGFELAAWGGTNFSKLELLRQSPEYAQYYTVMANIGHGAMEMIQSANEVNPNMPLIISGGVRDFLDGFYYLKNCQSQAVYGLASRLLAHADDYSRLCKYLECEIEGLKFATRFLRLARK